MSAMSGNLIIRLKRSVVERDHVIGPPTAPVTLVEYGNFECIDCGRVYPVIREVRKHLGDSLRFVFRNFPTVKTHPHSLRAAEAAEAASAQGKFWQMHDELFTHQRALEARDLSRYAKRIGLDADRFEHDLAENVFLPQIEADYQSSIFDEHVTGTPTLYLNEVRYTGATDIGGLMAAIKAADSKGQIQWPASESRWRALLDKLRKRAEDKSNE
jgi:formate-nitrite transporter family protein